MKRTGPIAVSLALLLGPVGAWETALFAQKREVSVYKVRSDVNSPGAEQAGAFVKRALEEAYDVTVYNEAAAEAILETLGRSGGGGTGPPAFIIGTIASVAQLVKADQRARTLERLKLYPVNPRAAGIPFFLFARAQTLNSLKGRKTPLTVAFGVSNKTRDLFDQSEAKAVIHRLVGIEPIAIRTTTDPNELLDYLLASGSGVKSVDLVGIYDEEPSALLAEFLKSHEPRSVVGDNPLRVQLHFLSREEPDFGPSLHVTNQYAAAWSVMPFEGVSFYDWSRVLPQGKADGLLTLSPIVQAPRGAPGMDMPVLLTNVGADSVGPVRRSPEAARLQQMVSASYLGVLLTSQAAGRCGGDVSPLFDTYLLHVVFADTQSVAKRLSIWSHLSLTSGNTGSAGRASSAERQLLKTMVDDWLMAGAGAEKKKERLSFASIVKVLVPQKPSVPVRHAFSSAYAEMFRSTTEHVRAAVENPRQRSAALAQARMTLLDLLFKDQEPACRIPGLGLFGEKGYDPFLYLSVIDSLLAMQLAS